MPLLARELRAGGDPSAVVEGRVEGAAILIWVGPPDKDALRAAKGAGVPIIALTDDRSVPYVLAEDMVRVPPGQGFPVDAIARAVARRLGENGTALAAKLPVLRPAVSQRADPQLLARRTASSPRRSSCPASTCRS